MTSLSELDQPQRQALSLGFPVSRGAGLYTLGSVGFTVPRYSRARSPIASQPWNFNTVDQPQALKEPPLSSQGEIAQNVPRGEIQASWLFDALLEIQRLPKTAEDNEYLPPTAPLLEHAATIARLCDEYKLSEPVFDVRDKGEVEIFCREHRRGLLIVAHPDDMLQVFGDFAGDQWRARYSLKGFVWKSHLRKFIQELTKNDFASAAN